MLYQIIYILLIIEFIVIIACLFAMVFIYFFTIYRREKHRKNQEYLRGIFLQCLKNDSVPQTDILIKKGVALADLLILMETFNNRFLGENWQAIKKAILTKEFLNEARKMTQSSSWIKRDRGIRFLKMAPDIQDQGIIIHLINDSHSLVRIQAALCAVQLETEPAILAVLKRMSQESDLGRYPYRDALVRADQKVFRIVEKIMLEISDDKVRSVCLDILSTHVNENLVPFMAQYLHSTDIKDKVTAVKILSNIPNKDSIHYLNKFIKDPGWQVRAQALQGLGQLKITSSIPQLAEALKDPVWQVRLEAALSLRTMGEEGIVILSRQDPDINHEAYEVAQYVLALPI